MREAHKLAMSLGANCIFTPVDSPEEVLGLLNSGLVQRLVLVRSAKGCHKGRSIRPLVASLLRHERLKLHEVSSPQCVASNFHLWFPPNTNDMSPS